LVEQWNGVERGVERGGSVCIYNNINKLYIYIGIGVPLFHHFCERDHIFYLFNE
jgi:hypothetical protein